MLVADDHPPSRSGVRDALDGHGFVVCAEASDGPSAVEAALRERPDICLIDIRMPGNGIAAAESIARRVPSTAIVMLTVSQSESDLFDALRAGAAGYLPKDIDPARLPDALRGVLDGEAALPRRLVALVLAEFRARSRRYVPLLQRRGVELTAREWEVLELLRQGLSTRAIAARLFIAPGTVRTHLAAIMKKLDAPDRRSALRLIDR